MEEMIDDAPSYETEIRGKKLSLCILYEGIYGRYPTALENNDTAELEILKGLYSKFATRMTECGFKLDSVIMGIDFVRSIQPTLEEEAKFWGYTK